MNRLFYNQKNKERNLANYVAIYEVMAKYYQGVEEAKLGLLDAVFHSDWAMRDNDVPARNQINVEDKPTFIRRVRQHGPYQDYAADRVLTRIDVHQERWAFVQITKSTSGNATLFFLIKTGKGWIILDKIWVITTAEALASNEENLEYPVIEKLLNAYQDGIQTQHDQYLQQVLDEKWDSKVLDGKGNLQQASRSSFFENLGQISLDLDEIKFINIYQSSLAIVQLENHKTSFISFIVLFYLEGTWRIASERGLSK